MTLRDFAGLNKLYLDILIVFYIFSLPGQGHKVKPEISLD